MQETLEVRLNVSPDGVTPRAYTDTLVQVARSLEELDRIAETDPKNRVAWFVSDTAWRKTGPIVRLRPEARTVARTTEELLRPSRAFVEGIRSLHRAPAIPDDFTEGIVKRVGRVSDLTTKASSGLEGVEVVSLADATAQPAPIDAVVDLNAKKAIAPLSLAYGSVIGRLDLISARRSTPKVGLVTDYGPPVTCTVSRIEREDYLRAFDSQVLVEGLIKRNSSGQIISIAADSLHVLAPTEPVTARELRGILSNPDGLTVAEFIEEQRGSR